MQDKKRKKLQGYLLSKPLVFDDFKALLLAQRGV
jgi:EAL domain-containing protein (putative c-di-GMP-specific phosphodiesterase class I)